MHENLNLHENNTVLVQDSSFCLEISTNPTKHHQTLKQVNEHPAEN